MQEAAKHIVSNGNFNNKDRWLKITPTSRSSIVEVKFVMIYPDNTSWRTNGYIRCSDEYGNILPKDEWPTPDQWPDISADIRLSGNAKIPGIPNDAPLSTLYLQN